MRTGKLSSQPRSQQDPPFSMPGFSGLLILGVIVSLFALVEMNLWPVPARDIRILQLLGGGLMLLSGFNELRRNNGFGTMVNFGYGFFWLSMSAFFYVPHGPARSDNPTLLASYVIMWGLFSCILFLGTLRQAYLLRTAMASLAVYLFALGAALLVGQPGLQAAAGGFGLTCGVMFLALGMLRLGGDIITHRRNRLLHRENLTASK